MLGYIDLQIFSCGLISILSHKFAVDVLLSRQTTLTLVELRARIDFFFLQNKTHFSLKCNKWLLDTVYDSRHIYVIIVTYAKRKGFFYEISITNYHRFAFGNTEGNLLYKNNMYIYNLLTCYISVVSNCEHLLTFLLSNEWCIFGYSSSFSIVSIYHAVTKC